MGLLRKEFSRKQGRTAGAHSGKEPVFMQGTYAQKNQEKLIKINFPDGLRWFCKSLILNGFKTASGLGNLLKPASILALRAVNRGLSTKLSTEIVDSLEMPYKPAS